jgi:signal transduction histidine kinase
MARRLKESVERSRREEESRKELMAGISHDLRSPLTSIQAYVEGLLDGVASTPEMQKNI